jgi:toxin ParE1/3/4
LQVLSIREYVGKRNVAAAKRIGAAIRGAVRLLQDFPNSGRAGSLRGTREWIVRGLPYIIVYEVLEDRAELHILGVFHRAQRRPTDP